MSKHEEDITVRLYKAGSTGLDLSPGDPLALEAMHKIFQLRNLLYLCIHGTPIANCKITDEGCAQCIIGKPPLIETLPGVKY